MVVGCGIDTEEIARFDKHISDVNNSGFVKMVYTKREIENFKSNYRKFLPISFCCKEAVFKSIENSWTISPVHWQDIELIFNAGSLSNYEIIISGYTKKIMNDLNNPKIVSEFSILPDNVTFHVILINE